MMARPPEAMIGPSAIERLIAALLHVRHEQLPEHGGSGGARPGQARKDGAAGDGHQRQAPGQTAEKESSTSIILVAMPERNITSPISTNRARTRW